MVFTVGLKRVIFFFGIGMIVATYGLCLEIKDLKNIFQSKPGYSYLDPTHGAIWWESGLIKVYYNEYPLSDISSDTIKLLHKLFRSARDELFLNPTIFDANPQFKTAKVMKIIGKKSNRTDQEQEGMLADLKKIVLNDDLANLIVKSLKECNHFNDNINPDDLYPPYTTHCILFAWLWKATASRNALKPYLEELAKIESGKPDLIEVFFRKDDWENECYQENDLNGIFDRMMSVVRPVAVAESAKFESPQLQKLFETGDQACSLAELAYLGVDMQKSDWLLRDDNEEYQRNFVSGFLKFFKENSVDVRLISLIPLFCFFRSTGDLDAIELLEPWHDFLWMMQPPSALRYYHLHMKDLHPLSQVIVATLNDDQESRLKDYAELLINERNFQDAINIYENLQDAQGWQNYAADRALEFYQSGFFFDAIGMYMNILMNGGALYHDNLYHSLSNVCEQDPQYVIGVCQDILNHQNFFTGVDFGPLEELMQKAQTLYEQRLGPLGLLQAKLIQLQEALSHLQQKLLQLRDHITALKDELTHLASSA